MQGIASKHPEFWHEFQHAAKRREANRRAGYQHSAYWYAMNYGWTYSEATTYAGKYWDMHTFIPRKTSALARFFGSDPSVEFDSTFNPLLLAAFAMVDIGVALKSSYERWSTPAERAQRRREFTQTLRILRRPFYYARETERRRELTRERRKLHRRRTTAPMPSPEDLRAAWRKRRKSKENMILLGGLLHDLECYVDNCLRFDDGGNVIGRNGGICGWLKEHVPELAPKYKTLMRYKAMAVKLRQATGTHDPKPTSSLLKKPRPELVDTILADPTPTFVSLERRILHELDPETVFLDAPKAGPPRRPIHS